MLLRLPCRVALIRSIRHTIILDDPFNDPPGLVFPDSSPVPRPEQLEVWLLSL
jgi:peptidyl-prolyl cis-trans isomerase-like 4